MKTKDSAALARIARLVGLHGIDLKCRREDAGVSLEDLALALGVTAAGLQNSEGKGFVSVEYTARYQAALDEVVAWTSTHLVDGGMEEADPSQNGGLQAVPPSTSENDAVPGGVE